MELLSAAAILVATVVSPSLAQDQDYCCDPQSGCKNVTTMDITVEQLAARSPYYEPILSTDNIAVNYRSVCVTYFRIRRNLYIEFRAIEQKNSSSIISVHLVSDLEPGVFRIQGPFKGQQGNSTTVYNTYIVGATCQRCQPIYMYYNCYLYHHCNDAIVKYEVVNGISSFADNAPSCLDAFESLAESKGFKVRGFTRLEGDSHSCVVQYGGAKCVNYNSVAPSNRVIYPLDDKC